MNGFINLLLCSFIFSAVAQGKALEIGKKAPLIKLSGDDGGLVKDGSEFKLDQIAGKLQVIWYVDPDEKDLNDYAVERQRSEDFPLEKVGSVAIINFEATMIPNWILGGVIESSQEKNKNTLYVKDMKKSLIKEWGLKDDSSNVIVLSKDLKVLYWFGGKLDEKATDEFLSVIKKNI